MTNIIKQIANKYAHLKPATVSRNQAFGVIYNNTEVGGVLLSQHEAGKRVTSQVMRQLGFLDKAEIKGSLDDF